VFRSPGAQNVPAHFAVLREQIVKRNLSAGEQGTRIGNFKGAA